MPKYVLPEVSDFDFVNFLKKVNNIDKLDKEFRINPLDRNILLGFFGKYLSLNAFDTEGTGVVLTEPEKIEACSRFRNSPAKVSIPFNAWDTFRGRVKSMEVSGKVPGDCEMGLRFYIGTDGDAVKPKYAVVIVPMYVPLVDGIYDRENEKEMVLFSDTGNSFFGLLALESKGEYTEKLGDCSLKIKEKDKYKRDVAYFSLEAIDEFISSLVTSPFTTMQLEFARTKNGFATIVLSCLDAGGFTIESNLPVKGPKKAVYFDQADLIPPPPDSGGLRDTFFPRP